MTWVISFQFDGPGGPVSIVRDAAERYESPALVVAAARMKWAFEQFFRDPQLMEIEEFMDVLGGIAVAYTLVTNEPLGDELTSEFFIRIRTMAIEMNRPIDPDRAIN